jgi:hypothetical protein
MTSRTTALPLLAVSAAAIDTDVPGFVHFKNWAGGVGAQSTVGGGWLSGFTSPKEHDEPNSIKTFARVFVQQI